MIFVDTSAWAPVFVPQDPLRDLAHVWMRENEDRLVTTDYILDELLTLLRTRFSTRLSIQAGEALWSEEFADIIFLTRSDIHDAWRVFRTHADKGWSFTDCTSSVVMKRLHISQAFSFDRHFSQMRGIRRVP